MVNKVSRKLNLRVQNSGGDEREGGGGVKIWCHAVQTNLSFILSATPRAINNFFYNISTIAYSVYILMFISLS